MLEQIQGISILFSGKAHVRWAEGKSRLRETQVMFYAGKQLWGDGKDSQELAAGRCEFPFKF